MNKTKLTLSLSIIMLAGCQGGSQSNTTPSNNQALTLNEYVALLDYTPLNQVSKANTITPQNGSTYQQSFTASQSVNISTIDVTFYNQANCQGVLLSNIAMNAADTQNPATINAGTYTSTNASNYALANRFQPGVGDGGASEEYSQTHSIKFVYHYTQAPTVTELCMSNDQLDPNRERIGNMTNDTACVSGQSCGYSRAWNAVLEFAGDGVAGWPEYVAQGGVLMDYTYYDPSVSVAEYNGRPVDAIFTYDNGEGSADLVAPTITLAAVRGAAGISSNNGHYTRPVIVHYTLNQSEGLNPAPLAESEMAKHFTKLIYNIQTMEHFYNADTNPYPGSFVMNPDTLGEIQLHHGTAPESAFAGYFAVNDAIHTAVCATSNEFTWNVPYAAGGGTYNGTGTAINVFFDMLTSAPWQDSGVQTWNANFHPVVYDNCDSSTEITSGVTIPTFTNDFKGWIQATNWIFKEFGPHTTFGWQENVWVISPGGTWVHDHTLTEAQVQTQYANPIYTWLNNEGVFNGTYRPDFIVFDKYERDAYEYTTNQTFINGWLWDQADFTNYIRYVKDVTANVGTDQNGNAYYAMLWQIPGGHLQYTSEGSLDVQHASTEPVMTFGDNTLTADFGNVKPVLLGTAPGNYTSLPAAYSLSGFQGQTPLNFLLNGSTVTPWQNSRMSEISDAHVFSILWGGGNTTSVGTKPWNDPWLSNKIIDYYTNTTPVQ